MAGEISFRPSERDYADANRDWFLAHLARPRAWIRMVVFILFFAGLGAVLAYIDGNLDEIESTAIGFACLGLVLMLFVYLSVYLALPRRTGRLYRQHKALHRTWTYRWSETGLSIETTYGLTTYPWADFHRWRDGRRTMLLFLNDQLFFYLPRRLLDVAEVDELGSLVAAAGVPRL